MDSQGSSYAPQTRVRPKSAQSRIDYFLHPSFYDNPDRLYRARILALTLCTLFGTAIIVLLPLVLAPLPVHMRQIGIPILLIQAIVMAGLLFKLKRDGSYKLCCNVAIGVVPLLIMAGVYLSGGITNSPVAQILAVTPLLAFFFSGIRVGGSAALFIGLLLLIVLLLQLNGFGFPQEMPNAEQIGITRALLLLIYTQIVATLAFFYDYTTGMLRVERDKEHWRVKQLAQTDALTGLANRRVFDEILAERIVRYHTAPKSHAFALCYLDLDGFKVINDRHGHDVGDQVLRAISIRFRSSLRGADIIGRRGGDEFMLLLDQLTQDSVLEATAQRFVKIISEPIETSAGLLSVGGSFGFALFPDHSVNAESLKKLADAAMYEAKRTNVHWRVATADQLPSTQASTERTQRVDAEIHVSCTTNSFAIDFFIHKRVRVNRDLLYRARILIFILVLVFGFQISALLVLLFVSMPTQVFELTLSTILIGFPIQSVALYLMKKGNYNASALMVVANAFIIIALSTFFTGGLFNSSPAQLFGIPCLMAFLFNGRRDGIVVTIMVLVTQVIFLKMQFDGFQFPQIYGQEFKLFSAAFSFPVNYIIVISLAFAYEFTYFLVKKERDQEHENFLQLAKTDPLTGIANRRMFDEALSAKITLYASLKPVRHFALCCLDLDKFKPINDQFGHDVGDEVLKEISMRLRSALRGADFIGRHGGDEFMMLLDSVQNTASAITLSRRLLRLVQEPIETSTGVMQVGASLGFAIFPLHGADTVNLQKSADAAMYEAKRSRSGFLIFSENGRRPQP